MKKILVVDNDPMFLAFMKDLLSGEGYDVMLAQDGLSALDLLNEHTPDVVFVDLVMPNVDGPTLCRIIRSMKKMDQALLVILSATAAEEGAGLEDLMADAWIAKGPLDRMGGHVLEILKDPERGSGSLRDRMLGQDLLYPRGITRELLWVKKHFELLLDKMSEGILEVVGDGRIVYANPAAIRIFGLPEEKLLGAHFLRLFAEQEQDRICGLRDDPDGEPEWISENSPILLSGRWITLRRFPLEPTRQMVILQDVTERKRAWAQIRQRQKLEAIGILTGGIAHDFNNILSAIMGFSELALLYGTENPRVRSSIEQVLRSTNRARDLIGQMLSFSRKAEQECRPFQVHILVKEMLKLLRASFPSTIQIRHRISCRISVINGDPAQIQQMIVNLCTNACRAMEPWGGVLGIDLDDLEDLPEDLQLTQEDLKPCRYLRLTVRDTGCGMDPEVLERIFDPYFTTRPQGKGSGLGLSVVHGIVKGHDGYISVESEPGKGTAFHVYFPLLEPPAVTERVDVRIPATTGKERILFVDDEELIVDLAREMLELIGYRVTAETRSEEALRIFREQPGEFDLVITDLTMPEISGIGLAETMLRIRPDIPIILCSGYSEKIEEIKAMRSGIRQILTKPVTLQDLCATIRKALGKEETGNWKLETGER